MGSRMHFILVFDWIKFTSFLNSQQRILLGIIFLICLLIKIKSKIKKIFKAFPNKIVLTNTHSTAKTKSKLKSKH